MNRLSKKDNTLCVSLNKINGDEQMKIGREFRNNLTHNYPPNCVGDMFKKEESEDETVFTGHIGRYTTTSEFVANIDGLIELLNECNIELKKKFIFNYE